MHRLERISPCDFHKEKTILFKKFSLEFVKGQKEIVSEFFK